MIDDSDRNFYYPNRYARSRKFLKGLLTKFRDKIARGEMVGSELFPFFYGTVKAALDNLDERTRQEKLGEIPFASNHPELTMEEQKRFILYSHFYNRGKNIFYFSNELTSLLKKTDSKEVSIENLEFPYRTFYLAFGKQTEWEIKKDVFVDGAFISKDNDYLQIELTTIDTNKDYKELKSYEYLTEDTFTTGIDLESQPKNIAEAIQSLYKQELEDFNKVDRGNIDELLNRPEFDDEYRDGVRWAKETFKEEFELKAQIQHKRTLKYIEVLKDISSLIFNSVSYLTIDNKDLEEGYIEGTPKALLDELKKAKTPKKKKEVSIKIDLYGYTRIKYCGFKDFKNDLNNASGELSPHWRRGHFRNQQFGEGSLKRKMIWIQPTIVRKDKGEPERGHIYKVE
jgi:hypothetical protein